MHTKWSLTGISQSVGLLQQDSGGYEKRTGDVLVVRAATAQPYSIRQLVPALQEKAEKDRGNAGSCQLCGPTQSRNRFDVSSGSQRFILWCQSEYPGLDTNFRYKIKTAAPRALLNFHFTTDQIHREREILGEKLCKYLNQVDKEEQFF